MKSGIVRKFSTKSIAIFLIITMLFGQTVYASDISSVSDDSDDIVSEESDNTEEKVISEDNESDEDNKGDIASNLEEAENVPNDESSDDTDASEVSEVSEAQKQNDSEVPSVAVENAVSEDAVSEDAVSSEAGIDNDDNVEGSEESVVVTAYTVSFNVYLQDENGEFEYDHTDEEILMEGDENYTPKKIENYYPVDTVSINASKTSSYDIKYERKRFKVDAEGDEGIDKISVSSDKVVPVDGSVFKNTVHDDDLKKYYLWGQKITIDVKPHNEYEVKSIKSHDDEFSSDEVPYSFVMPKYDLDFSISSNKVETENEAGDASEKDVTKDENIVEGKDAEYEVKSEEAQLFAVNELSSNNVSQNEAKGVSENSTVLSNTGVSQNSVYTGMYETGIDIGNTSVAITSPATSTSRIKDKDNTYIVEDESSHSITLCVKQQIALLPQDRWESGDKTIATVNNKGAIKGKKIGKTVIHRYGVLETDFNVEVVDPSGLAKGSKGFVEGDTVVIPRGKTITPALLDTWSVVDPKIVKINKKTGVAKALKSGTTTVTVSGTHNRKYIIKVEDPDILIENKTINMAVGDEINIADKLLYTSLPVTFQTQNPSVAEVSVWGDLKALKVGSTKLFAIVNGRKYTFKIKIKSGTVSGGNINAETVYLAPRKSFKLKVTFNKGEQKLPVNYSIASGDSVISISNKGKITAKSEGMACVNVNIGGVDKYKVIVIVEGDKVDLPKSVSINVGDYYYISPSVSQNVVWTSSNPKVASVNEFGVVYGIKTGKANIKGKISGKKYTVQVNVVNAGAEKLYNSDFTVKSEILETSSNGNPSIMRVLDISGEWKLVYSWDIAYNLNGGHMKDEEENPAYYNRSSSFKLKNPVKDNYVFAGWELVGSDKLPQIDYEFKKGQEGPKTFNATWASALYSITYDLDGGYFSSDEDNPNPTVYTVNTNTFTLKNPVRYGYTFVGWSGTDIDSSKDFSEKVIISRGSTGNRAYKANWVANEYRVSFHGNGATEGEMEDMHFTFETPDTNLIRSIYRRDGYYFTRWLRDNDINRGAFNDEQAINGMYLESAVGKNGVLNLYVDWTVQEFPIHYIDTEGSDMTGAPKSYFYDSTDVHLITPTKPGYTFVGWKDLNDPIDDEPKMDYVIPSGSTRVYLIKAYWIEDEYTVKFHPNGGSGRMEDMVIKYTDSITLSANQFLYNGNDFRYWIKDSSYDYRAFVDEDIITGEELYALYGHSGTLNLYAVWQPSDFKVSTISNDKVESVVGTGDYKYGDFITLRAVPVFGYEVTSWSNEDDEELSSDNPYSFTLSANDVTLKINTTPKVYEMYLDPMLGSVEPGKINVTYDSEYGELPQAYRVGYTFDGWALDKEGKNTVSSNTVLSGNDIPSVLYAVWHSLDCRVSVLSDNTIDEVTGEGTYQFGNMVSLKAVPKFGYDFVSWIDTNEDDDELSTDNPYSFTLSENDVKLKVKTAPKVYEMYLDPMLGSVEPGKINVTYDSEYGELPQAYRVGYTFDGWALDKEGKNTVSSNTVLSGNNIPSVLYAQYTKLAKVPYKVRHYQQMVSGNAGIYDSNNYILTEELSLEEVPGESVTPEVRYYEGFTSPAVQTVTINADGSTVCNYYYVRHTHEVDIVADGGISSVTGSGNYKYGADVAVDSVVKDGYTIDGWYENVSSPGMMFASSSVKKAATKDYDFVMKDADISLDVRTKSKISFDANGGTVSPAFKIVTYDEPYGDLPEPERVGHVFVGWYNAQDELIVSSTRVSSSEAHTLTAKWRAVPVNYTVNHWKSKLNGIESSEDDDNYELYETEHLSATALTEVTPDVKDYPGFSAQPEKTALVAADGSTVVNYYYIRNKYKMEASKGDGILSVIGAGTYASGGDLVLIATCDEGYHFKEWVDSEGNTFSTQNPLIMTMAPNDIELKAVSELNKYTVRFNNNLSSGEYVEQEFTYGQTQALSANSFAKNGYEFVGWSSKSAASDAQYKDGQEVENLSHTNGAIVNLYAVWKAGMVTVKLDDGKGNISEIEASYDAKIGVLPTPSSNGGMAFIGWYDDDNKKIESDTNISSLIDENGNVKLIAKWASFDSLKALVYHYKQNVGMSNVHNAVNYSLADVEVVADETGSYTPEVKNYEGFSSPEPQTVELEGSCKVVNYYYDRNKYTLALTHTEGIASVIGDGVYEFGEKVSISAKTLSHYEFSSWDGDIVATNADTVITMPAHGMTLSAVAEPERHRLTIVLDDGMKTSYINNSEVQDAYIAYGSTVEVNSEAAEGYSFNKYMAVNVNGSNKAKYSFVMPAKDVTLVAVTKANPFELTIRAKNNIKSVGIYGDTSMTHSYMTAGSAVYVTAEPDTGYHFLKWDGTHSSKNAIYNFYMPSEDVTLTATSEANSYTIKYDSNSPALTDGRNTNYVISGSMPDTVHYYDNYYEHRSGGPANACTNLRENTYSIPGFTFKGWSRSATASEPEFEDGEYILNLTTVDNDVITMYAVWERNNYNFTINKDSHISSVTVWNQKVTNDTKVLSIPYNDDIYASYTMATGYTFTSWTDPDGVLNTHRMPYKNISLTANCRPNSYKIRYNSNSPALTDGRNTNYVISGSMPDTVHYYDNYYEHRSGGPANACTNLRTNTYSIPGFTFKGWSRSATASEPEFTNGGYVINLSSIDNDVITMYAVWERNNYTLTVNKDSHIPTVTVHNTTLTDSSKVLAIPYNDDIYATYTMATGYSFKSWTDPDGILTTHRMPYKNTSITANCRPNTYTVKFNGNGATSGSTSDQGFTYDVAQNLRSNGFKRTNYTFKGWSNTASGGVNYSNAQSVSNLTAVDKGTVNLYAVWALTIDTLKFDANGNTTHKASVSPSSKSITRTQKYGVLPTPTRTGYRFDGWYTAASGGTKVTENTIDNLTTDGSGSITVYAHWTINTYHMTFNANGGEGSSEKDITYDTVVTGWPSVSRIGYSFNGWYTQASGGSKINTSTYKMPAGATSVYAHWTAITYTATFYNDGGYYWSTSGHYGDSVSKPSNPSKGGYTFNGWSGYESTFTRDFSCSASWTQNTPSSVTYTWHRTSDGTGTSSETGTISSGTSSKNLFGKWYGTFSGSTVTIWRNVKTEDHKHNWNCAVGNSATVYASDTKQCTFIFTWNGSTGTWSGRVTYQD